MVKKKKAKKLYLLTLAGQGDLYIKVVNKATWNWIFSSFTGDGNDPNVPEHQKKLRKKDYDGDESVWITSGSCENDRAMQCCSDEGYETYYSSKDAMKALNKTGDKIIEEWVGCVY